MKNFFPFFKLQDWIFSKKRRNGIGLIFVFIVMFFLIRGCSDHPSSHHLYHIGQDERWINLNLMGKERNLSAFNTDLLSKIAKLENIYIQLNSITSDDSLITKLENGDLQGVISTLQPNGINQNNFVFSDPYFLIGPVLVISSAAPLTGWNERARKIVGVQSNSPALLNLEKDPTIQIKLYDNILRALADLDDNRIDGVVFPVIPTYIYTNTFYEGRLKIATPPLTNAGLRLIALKNERGEQLIKSFNQGLKTLKEDGFYDHLLNQWELMKVIEK
jgi:polar amino acid transport system substrate-binding protein